MIYMNRQRRNSQVERLLVQVEAKASHRRKGLLTSNVYS